MGAEEYRNQIKFEHDLKVGDTCRASWTNSYRVFTSKVKILVINKLSYRVKMLETVDGYPTGWKLNIPRYLNARRFTWNNRLFLPEEEVAP
jgi:hypothetical protein